MQIIELIDEEGWRRAFPLMNVLRTHLTESEYIRLVKKAVELDQYHLFAYVLEEEIIALVGFKPMVTLYYGEFVWVSDLVTAHHHRSHGYGQILLTFVHEWTMRQGYNKVALSSGIQRTEAHRFYEEKMTYDRVSYVFKKEL